MAPHRVGHPAGHLAFALSLLCGSQVALAQTPQPAPQPDSAQPPADPNQPPPGYQPYAPADPNQPYPPPQPGGYYQPPPPGYQPPPPGYQPPPPGYQPYPTQPYGQPYAQPYTPQPRRPWAYTPAFRPQFGLGMRFGGSGQWNSAAGSYSQGGVGLELLFRVLPRLTLELSVQYQKVGEEYYSDGYYTYYGGGPTAANGFYYDRHDVPILGGARIHLGKPLSPLSPYLVGAFGATYARLYQPDSYFYEEHWFGEAQGGVGLEIRGGRHFYLSLDLRGFGRFRSIDLNSPSEGRYTDAFGVTVPSMGNQGGVLFNFGIGGYF